MGGGGGGVGLCMYRILCEFECAYNMTDRQAKTEAETESMCVCERDRQTDRVYMQRKMKHPGSGSSVCVRVDCVCITLQADQLFVADHLNLNLNHYVEVPRSLVLYDVGGLR